MKIVFLVTSLLLLASCHSSKDNEEDTKVSLTIPAISKNRNGIVQIKSISTVPHAPSDVSGFNCLMVNIVGPGIGSWSSNRDRVALGRNFSYVGNFSRMVPVETGGVVQVSVPRGASRYIQLIGIISTVGCPSSFTASDLNSTTQFPGLFIVGDTQVDIYESKTVSVISSYSQSTTSDLRGTPDNPIPPGVGYTISSSGTSVTISPSGSRTLTSAGTLTYTITADAGKFTSPAVGGTCPLGSWSGSNYTTGTISSGCTVSFSAYATVTYTTIYNGNGNTGGSTPRDNNAYTSGTNVTVLGNTGSLTKTGGTFQGWNLQADGCGTDHAAASTFSITANKTLYAKWSNTYFVSTSGNDTTGTGSSSAPYATIAKALTQMGCAGGDIKIASGTYSLSASITLKNNVNLLGGYDSSWSRNISSNQTILKPTANGNLTFISGTNLSGNLLIEGIYFQSFLPDNGTNGYTGIYLSNCPNTVIKYNNFQLSTTNGSVTGISISGNYNSQILGNYINSFYNSIDGRYANGITLTGLLSGSNFKVSSNVVDSAAPTLINGTPQPIVLKSCTGTYTAYIRNNTLRLGTKAGVHTFAFGNELGTPTINLYFDNNITFSGPAINGFTNGVYCAAGATCNIQSMKNNNFFNVDYLYQNVGSAISYTTVAALNAGIGTASGNISTEMVTAGYFENAGSANYRLSAIAPATIADDGIDGNSAGWSFSTDADQVTRTTNWSLGAYEK